MGKVWTFSTSQTGLRMWKRQEKPFIGSARSTGDLGSKYYTERNPSWCCIESASVFSPAHPRLQDVGKERITVSGCPFGNSSIPHWATSNAHLYLSILWASHFKDSQYWILLEPEAISYKCILSSSLRWKHFLSKIQHFVVTSIFPRNFLSGTLLKFHSATLEPKSFSLRRFPLSKGKCPSIDPTSSSDVLPNSWNMQPVPLHIGSSLEINLSESSQRVPRTPPHYLS